MSSKKRVILVDADAAAIATKSGIGYYVAGMLEALAKNTPEDTMIVAHYFNFLGKQKPALPQNPKITYKQSKIVPRQAANLLRRMHIPLPYELLTRTRADFIIFPNFLRRSLLFKTPYAAAVHDLTYLELPDYVSEKNRRDLTNLVPWTLDKASFVIAISKTMEAKIREHYPQYKNPIVAELLPVEQPRKLSTVAAEKALKDMDVTGKYILFIGNLEPRKNLSNLVRAYQELPDNLQAEYSLVLAGGQGWNNQQVMNDIQEAQQAGLKVITPGYITDDQRVSLYQNASLFAFVSSYEGYGIPVLEAMSYEVPVVASNIPVLREVAGDAATLCDPNDVKAIAAALEKTLQDTSLRETLIKKGRANVASKSWDDLAQVYLSQINNQLT